MSLTRRLLLAFALLAGVVPAFAQAPPPVPALPDTERRTSYVIAGTTCACAVNFALYGDSTDYGNWLEVWLNGVLQSPSTYTITSPTGPLATIPRPITDAVLTFNAVQTGTVQIVGARRPRRVSQFTEGRGVAARDLNQVLTDVIAQNREIWDKTNDVTGRAILGLPGETLSLLPAKASRASNFLYFDVNGNPTVAPGNITPIAPVTNAMLAPMPANTVKCNPTGSTANAQDCTSPIVSGSITSTVNLTGTTPLSSFLASSPNVSYGWQVTGNPTDQKNWDAAAGSNVLQFRAVNDANTVANAWMTVTRGAGATVSGVSIPNLNGVFDATASFVAGGVTDNSTALNTIFTAVGTSGGSVRIPCGKYRVNSASLSIASGKSVTITGGGADCTTINSPSGTTPIAITLADSTSSFHVRDLSVTTGTTNTGNGISVVQTTSSTNPANSAQNDFTNVTIRGDDGYALTDYWATGIALSGGVSEVNFTNIFMPGDTAFAGTGVSLIGDVTNSRFGTEYNFTDSTFNFLANGIFFGNFIQGVICSQCSFTADNFGIVQTVGVTGGFFQLAVTASQFNCRVAGINIQTLASIVLLSGNTFGMDANSAVGVSGNLKFFSIVGNNFVNTSFTTTNGIVAAASSSVGVISGNSFIAFATAVNLQAGTATTNVQSNIYSGNTSNTFPATTTGSITIGGGSP